MKMMLNNQSIGNDSLIVTFIPYGSNCLEYPLTIKLKNKEQIKENITLGQLEYWSKSYKISTYNYELDMADNVYRIGIGGAYANSVCKFTLNENFNKNSWVVAKISDEYEYGKRSILFPGETILGLTYNEGVFIEIIGGYIEL